jgi:hypothetical protein
MRPFAKWRWVSNWSAVLRYAWSIRLMALAALLSGAEVAIPYLDGVLPIPSGLFGALAGVTTLGAMLARMIAQAPLDKDKDK